MATAEVLSSESSVILRLVGTGFSNVPACQGNLRDRKVNFLGLPVANKYRLGQTSVPRATWLSFDNISHFLSHNNIAQGSYFVLMLASFMCFTLLNKDMVYCWRVFVMMGTLVLFLENQLEVSNRVREVLYFTVLILDCYSYKKNFFVALNTAFYLLRRYPLDKYVHSFEQSAMRKKASKRLSTPRQTQLRKPFSKSLLENTRQQIYTVLAGRFSQASYTAAPSRHMPMAPARVGADDPNRRESPDDLHSISMGDRPRDLPSNGESSSVLANGSGGRRRPDALEPGDPEALQNWKAGIFEAILVLGVELFEFVINLVSQKYVSQQLNSKILQYFAWTGNLIAGCLGAYVIQRNIRNRGVAPPIMVKTTYLVAALSFVADNCQRLSDELMLLVFFVCGMVCIAGYIAF